jgi:hypothetical protein
MYIEWHWIRVKARRRWANFFSLLAWYDACCVPRFAPVVIDDIRLIVKQAKQRKCGEVVKKFNKFQQVTVHMCTFTTEPWPRPSMTIFSLPVHKAIRHLIRDFYLMYSGRIWGRIQERLIRLTLLLVLLFLLLLGLLLLLFSIPLLYSLFIDRFMSITTHPYRVLFQSLLFE